LRFLCDEAHVLDTGRAELVHRVHDRSVLDSLISLDEDDLLVGLLVFQEHLHDLSQRIFVRDFLGVQVDVLVLGNRDRGLAARFRFVHRIGRLRQGDGDALLQQRGDEHHDDEEHQHDVDERRHVDIGFDSAFGAPEVHSHRSISYQ